MHYFLTLIFSIFYISSVLSQNCITFKKENDCFKIEKVGDGELSGETFDKIYADYCSVVGEKVFALTNKSVRISTPAAILIEEYDIAKDSLKLAKRYFISASIETIQVIPSLQGGYLHLISRTGVEYPNVRPQSILQPFTQVQMSGEKKIVNVALNNENLSRLEGIIKDFNDW